MASTIIFISLYLVSIHVEGNSYLLCMSAVILEIYCIVKQSYRYKSRKNRILHSSLSHISVRPVINQAFRCLCYVWMIVWTIAVELSYEKLGSYLMVGFIPIAAYSVISIGVDFFLTSAEKIYNLYTSTYRAFRLVFYIQLVTLARNAKRTANSKLDVDDLSSNLWPIQVGALLLSPAAASGIVYYSYFLVVSSFSKTIRLDRRHYLTFAWFIFTSISVPVVAVLCIKFKQSLFERSETVSMNLSLAIVITTVNIALTLVIRRQLS